VAIQTASKTQHYMNSGQHWLSQNAIPMHVGLGAEDTVAGVTVKWPSGLEETFTRVSADRLNTLVEGTSAEVNQGEAGAGGAGGAGAGGSDAGGSASGGADAAGGRSDGGSPAEAGQSSGGSDDGDDEDGGGGGEKTEPDEGSDCGCRAVGRSPAGSSWGLVALLGLLALRRRTQRS
jgi:MYXO-CTERM domain-containing protein